MSATSSDEDPEWASDGSDGNLPPRKPPGTKFMTPTPLSPRKRALSCSGAQHQARKRFYKTRGPKYNDDYRIVFNDTVTDATTRFAVDPSFHPQDSVIGVSTWSKSEKAVFFAALDRLGRDDVPGIAKAIGTKTILETRQYLLRVQEAFLNQDPRRQNVKIVQQDIPAALEVRAKCEHSLDLEAESLAFYQERFEAKLEQERYGEYWLITPAVADEIELGMKALGDVQVRPDAESGDNMNSKSPDKQTSSALQQIPEAELLNPAALLYLSRHFFMNSSPKVAHPWPNWSELTSEHAAEPSIYRSAFTDLYSLVVSLTRRIMQTAMFQATSRIRSRYSKSGQALFLDVKKQDVLTAVDILGLSRNGWERWSGVARRCGLQVKRHAKAPIIPWADAESILLKPGGMCRRPNSNAESAGLASATDDETFEAKTVRSRTPQPGVQPLPTSDSDADVESQASHLQEVDSDSDEDQYPSDSDSDASMLDGAHAEDELSQGSTDEELEILEEFDKIASRAEEKYLRSLLHQSETSDPEIPRPEAETAEPETKHRVRVYASEKNSDWRHWVQYRAPWEEFHKPVPHSSFHDRPVNIATAQNAPRDQTDPASGNEHRSQARSQHHNDIPIRGARAYAAMQERFSVPADGGEAIEDGDDSDDISTQPIEHENGDTMDID